MPFLDEGAELVSGDVHAVEVGIAVVSLNFLNLDLNLSPVLFVGLTVQVSERNLEDTSSERISWEL